jgi:Double-GTPase 1
MGERSVVIIGLPASGKTTFLAALWHLVTARDIDTRLRFGTLRIGDVTHLNAIAARWREAKVQDRTAVLGTRVVSMNLVNGAGEALRVTFPDVPGEAYRRMWEERECESQLVDILKATGVLLFIHADTIHAPRWVVDEVALSRELGLGVAEGEVIAWHPRLAPTQVQVIDLLQLLRTAPLDIGPRRLAVMLSAWDKARAEGLSPAEYLQSKLPLLAQYLRRAADGWDWRVYGLSAQGGDYDPLEQGERVPEAEELRRLDRPSTRIQLVGEGSETHDLTEPLAWLMG